MPRLLVTLLVLFLWYQAPEGLARLGVPFPVWATLMLLFLPVAWGLGRWLGYRPGLAAYALEPRRGALQALLLALLLALVLRALALPVGSALGILSLSPLAQPPAVSALLLGVGGALVTTFFPSLAEDILTRGLWYRAWPVAGRGGAYVLFTALLYVLNHVYRLHLGPREWGMLFCMGLAFAAATVRTGSLWAAVGLHWGWNLSGSLFDLAVDTQVLAPTARPLLSAATALALCAAAPLLPRVQRDAAPQPAA
jgi:membrane protease YdiL (CAAX protease family)